MRPPRTPAKELIDWPLRGRELSLCRRQIRCGGLRRAARRIDRVAAGTAHAQYRQPQRHARRPARFCPSHVDVAHARLGRDFLAVASRAFARKADSEGRRGVVLTGGGVWHGFVDFALAAAKDPAVDLSSTVTGRLPTVPTKTFPRCCGRSSPPGAIRKPAAAGGKKGRRGIQKQGGKTRGRRRLNVERNSFRFAGRSVVTDMKSVLDGEQSPD